MKALRCLRRIRLILPLVWLLVLTPRNGAAQVFRVQLSSAASSRLQPTTIEVDLDAYVAGVLTGEASTLRSPQALDAMAVIVRTWARRHQGRHRAQGFDFCTLTHCEVFRRAPDSGGYSEAVLRAVRETRDEVLEYHGQLIDPYFSADCGGTTESAVEVWPDKSFPYLRISPDPYCAGSSHASWERTMPLRALESILGSDLALPLHGTPETLEVVSRDASGRAHTLAVEAGGRLLFDANQFRYAVDRRLGWGQIKSNLYTVERRGDELVFRGRGLGHGVGLCQAGADGMGRMGIGYPKILAQYFPGTDMVRLPPPAAADPVSSSEHFELAYPASQKKWVDQSLSALERGRNELEIPVGAWPDRLRAQTWDSTADFVCNTGKPGWAAGTNDGQSIFLQPLGLLAAKGILQSTLRHELAHVAIHRLRAPGVPSWYEEGLALYLTGERFGDGPDGPHSHRTMGDAIARASSEAEMHQAYARAARLVRDLAARRGRSALWQILKNPSADDLKWLQRESTRRPTP